MKLQKDYSFCITLSLIYAILLHSSPCTSRNIDNNIPEYKIKTNTSDDLTSINFDEHACQFTFFENLITQRLESVLKSDPKKFKEFRKVHQYYGIKNVLSSRLFFDMTFGDRNAENLELFKNKINWTEAEIIKYGLLVKDDEYKTDDDIKWNRDYKFHKEAMAQFFVAQYFYDNLIHPSDHPSDDEIELRIKFLLHMTVDDLNLYEDKPIPDKCTMAMIEEQNGEIFNDQVRMIMKYRFKRLLDLFPLIELNTFEKISIVFEKDKEVLGNLWGIDDDQPFFIRFLLNYAGNDNLYKVKKIADKFFKILTDQQIEANLTSNLSNTTSTSRADNLFHGKNQIINVLCSAFKKNDKKFTTDILNFTKYEVSDEILQKLNQTENFFDFVDSSSYSKIEKKNFYLSNSYHLIYNASNGSDLLELWNRIQKYFSNNELKKILAQKDPFFNHTQLFLILRHKDLSYIETFFNLTRLYLNNDEIKDFLRQKSGSRQEIFLVEELDNLKILTNFKISYNFTKEYFDHEELKSLIFGSSPTNFIYKVSTNELPFLFFMNLMAEFYTKDEIRKFMMQTDDIKFNILFWGVRSSRYTKKKEDIINYLKEMFKGQEDKLKELFRMRNYRGETVLGSSNRNYNKDGLKPFLEFAEELFTKEEIEELKNTVKESN